MDLAVARAVASRLDRVETVFADQVYQGLEEKIRGELGWTLQVVESEEEGSGFSVEPKRWIVERTYVVVRRLAPVGSRVRAANQLQRDEDALRYAPNRSGSTRLKIKTDS